GIRRGRVRKRLPLRRPGESGVVGIVTAERLGRVRAQPAQPPAPGDRHLALPVREPQGLDARGKKERNPEENDPGTLPYRGQSEGEAGEEGRRDGGVARKANL